MKGVENEKRGSVPAEIEVRTRRKRSAKIEKICIGRSADIFGPALALGQRLPESGVSRRSTGAGIRYMPGHNKHSKGIVKSFADCRQSRLGADAKTLNEKH